MVAMCAEGVRFMAMIVDYFFVGHSCEIMYKSD